MITEQKEKGEMSRGVKRKGKRKKEEEQDERKKRKGYERKAE